MLEDLYLKPLEQILIDSNINLTNDYDPFLPEPEKQTVTWKAEKKINERQSKVGFGETPLDAIIDLHSHLK